MSSVKRDPERDLLISKRDLQVGTLLPAGFIDTPNEEASPYYSFETGVTIALVRMCSIIEMCALIRI